MRFLLLTALLLLPASVGWAETIKSPHLAPGDTWTIEEGKEVRGTRRTSHFTMTLVRADSRDITVEVHPAGTMNPGPERLFGPDWSRVRSVNGQQTVVNRPLAFPLSLGKTWTLDYAEFNPNRAHTRERWQTTYRATHWEDVTVPAGTFRALKIEADGTWTADLPPNALVVQGRAPNGANVAVATRQGARVASGRLMKTFWYVPSVHHWVKAEEDIFDTNGVRTEHDTQDLEAFTPGVPAAVEAGPEAESPKQAAPAPHRATHAKVHRKVPAAAPHPAPAAAPPPGLQETLQVVPHLCAMG